MTTTIDQTCDLIALKYVGFNVVRETTANELAHIASKMPYASDADAQYVYDYLSNRFTFWGFRNATGIKSPEMIIQRANLVRAAAENAAAGQEVAA